MLKGERILRAMLLVGAVRKLWKRFSLLMRLTCNAMTNDFVSHLLASI